MPGLSPSTTQPAAPAASQPNYGAYLNGMLSSGQIRPVTDAYGGNVNPAFVSSDGNTMYRAVMNSPMGGSFVAGDYVPPPQTNGPWAVTSTGLPAPGAYQNGFAPYTQSQFHNADTGAVTGTGVNDPDRSFIGSGKLALLAIGGMAGGAAMAGAGGAGAAGAGSTAADAGGSLAGGSGLGGGYGASLTGGIGSTVPAGVGYAGSGALDAAGVGGASYGSMVGLGSGNAALDAAAAGGAAGAVGGSGGTPTNPYASSGVPPSPYVSGGSTMSSPWAKLGVNLLSSFLQKTPSSSAPNETYSTPANPWANQMPYWQSVMQNDQGIYGGLPQAIMPRQPGPMMNLGFGLLNRLRTRQYGA